jgi:hypothetical protein
MYAWEGLAPDVDFTRMVEARISLEEKWYALTGRVVEAKVEADGDIHLALQDANGNNAGTVSADIGNEINAAMIFAGADFVNGMKLLWKLSA